MTSKTFALYFLFFTFIFSNSQQSANIQQELYENAKVCYICKEKFKNKCLKDKKYRKLRDHCHYPGEPGEYRDPTYSICSLKNSAPKKSLDFHNGSNYGYKNLKNNLVV